MTSSLGAQSERRRIRLRGLVPPIEPGALRRALPGVAAHLDHLNQGSDWEVAAPGEPTVFATRSLAREIAPRLPDGPVVLDCTGVEVLSPPFIAELLKLRPQITPDGLNEDTAEAWAIAAPGAQEGGGDRG